MKKRSKGQKGDQPIAGNNKKEQKGCNLFIEANFPVFQGGGDDRKKEVEEILCEKYKLKKGRHIFSGAPQLWMRIFYFDPEKNKHHQKDLHNVIKPLLDIMTGFIYPDGKYVIYVECTKILTDGLFRDAKRNTAVYITHDEDGYTLELKRKYLNSECCWVEIGELQKKLPASHIRVNWKEFLLSR